jgi:hypothetical protein
MRYSSTAAAAATLRDRPDDQGLAATGVAGDEHAGRGRLVVVAALDVAAAREHGTQLVERCAPGR